VLCDVSTGREVSAFFSASKTTVASSSDESILGDISAGTTLFSETEVGRVDVCPDSMMDVGE
jgi:hypothetical protein